MAAASHTYVALRPTWNAWNNLASRTGARVTATVPGEVCYSTVHTRRSRDRAHARARGHDTSSRPFRLLPAACPAKGRGPLSEFVVRTG
eukprot:COSAG03_NODE_7721_length_880_cov_0.731114_2_plen_89_part_00